MKYLLLIYFIIIPVQCLLPDVRQTLAGGNFKLVLNREIELISQPRWMELNKNTVKFTTTDRTKYILNIDDNVLSVLSKDKNIRSPSRSVTDVYGNFFELVDGELLCTPYSRSRNPSKVRTKPNMVVTFLAYDIDNDVIYLLTRDTVNNVHGKLFSFKTTSSFGKDNIIQAEEAKSFFLHRILYMAVFPKNGNIAFAIKTTENWKIMVYQRINDMDNNTTNNYVELLSTTTERRRLLANERFLNSFTYSSTTERKTTPISTTEIPTTTKQTITASSNVTDLMTSNNKLLGTLENMRRTILNNLENIKLLYEKDRRSCQNIEQRYENLLKRYIRTLELTDTEESEMRKNYTPETKIKSFDDTIRQLIDSSITNLHRVLMEYLEDTTDAEVFNQDE